MCVITYSCASTSVWLRRDSAIAASVGTASGVMSALQPALQLCTFPPEQSSLGSSHHSILIASICRVISSALHGPSSAICRRRLMSVSVS